MNKKLFAILIVMIVAAIGFSFKKREPDLLAERPATESEITETTGVAVELVKIARRSKLQDFSRQLKNIAPENIETAKELLESIEHPEKPMRVTAPAVGTVRSRRFVYYSQGTKTLCLEVNRIGQDQWQFLGLTRKETP